MIVPQNAQISEDIAWKAFSASSPVDEQLIEVDFQCIRVRPHGHDKIGDARKGLAERMRLGPWRQRVEPALGIGQQENNRQ